MKSKTCLIALSLSIALASCADKQKQPAPAAKKEVKKEVKEEVTEVEPKVAKVAKSKMHGLDKKQRSAFMKTEVMPKMIRLFKAFDATHFTKVTCATCHGPGAREGKFEMPTAALPKLDFSKKDPKQQKWNEFMGKKVVPTMATILGVKPYDKATKTGFGCLSCHMKADKSGS